ncbi:anti-sigma factor family protein [Actinocatenispora rupis]|uniref:Anti-sigma factor n=1 Tax=Actinocatenispora rupis TaxID=519421 RepID=A0A8J3JDD4_9ACTN|nr:zf-HC2 domain-containing protein [Actinocatenispora rupis]GID16382.1 anti-sigma factor [Actinocatenispora rupis]
MTSDEFHHDAAAYVLGALSPEERHRYEEHLASCADCRDEVRALDGLPGLLSRVPLEEVTAEPVEPPPAVLTGLLQAAWRRRRRTRWLTAAGGAVAAALVLILALVLAFGPRQQNPAGQPMAAVTPAPVTATVALAKQPWGTDVTLRCRYTGPADYGGGYTLVAVLKSGRTEQISAWAAVPDTTAVLTGTTSASPDQIRSVQVRTGAGTTVLTMSP